MQIQTYRPPELGNFMSALGITGLFSPRQGQTIMVPGTPMPLSMAVVGALVLAVLGVAVLKKKRIV